MQQNPASQAALRDFRDIQLSALKRYGQYYCSVCEEPIRYQARRWAFCTNCGEICHPRCLSGSEAPRCFRCTPQ